MDTSHVIYRPAREDIGRSDYWVEVWRGLPNVHFESSETRDGRRGLMYSIPSKRGEPSGDYIWVVPDTAKALEQDPSSLLRVICRKQPSGALYAWDVTNYEGTEEEAIARAKKVTEGWKKEAEQTLQKEQAAIFRRSARKDNL